MPQERRTHEHRGAVGVSICKRTPGAIMRTPSSHDRTVRLIAVLVLVCSTSAMGLHEVQAQQRYVTLTGTVTDLRTQEPLRGVSVIIDDGVVATTTADGTFQVATILIKPGSNVVTFRRLGYRQVAKLLWIAGDQSDVGIQVTLESLAVRLATIVVAVEPGARGKLRGFYERRRTQIGEFLGPAEIERRRQNAVSDILATMPGILVNPGGGIRFARKRPRCRGLQFYLDGLLLRSPDDLGLSIDQIVNHEDIVAIEVYSGPARVPLQYSATNSDCGVILFWTR